MIILTTLSKGEHLGATLWTVTYLLDLLQVRALLRRKMVVNADNINDISLTFAVKSSLSFFLSLSLLFYITQKRELFVNRVHLRVLSKLHDIYKKI